MAPKIRTFLAYFYHEKSGAFDLMSCSSIGGGGVRILTGTTPTIANPAVCKLPEI